MKRSVGCIGALALFGAAWTAQAAAPLRSGQPYAEATLCATPDVIFCEDFNYPGNFIWTGTVENNNSTWINAGLVGGQTTEGFIFGLEGRRINPATTYPAKPQGAMPSGSQPDHTWVGNWDPALGATGNGSTWGKFRAAGGTTYANGTPVAKDIHVRYQVYWTADWVWPGDPKNDIYEYGSQPCTDNKLVYVIPPEGISSPTDSAAVAGSYTNCGVFSPSQAARFADALAFRYGSSGDNFKHAPLCSQCTSSPQFNDYLFSTLTFRNPNDTPTFGRTFRFTTNRWYTVEFRYVYPTVAGGADGRIQAWVDGTLIYDFQNIQTCAGGGLGSDCAGLGFIDLAAYHNDADINTVWDGQQVIDNLVISRSFIGPPGGGSPPPPPLPPNAPKNLRITDLFRGLLRWVGR